MRATAPANILFGSMIRIWARAVHRRRRRSTCGCLRAGYWLIHFLDPGCYCGIEPHRQRVELGLTYLLEPGLAETKRPRFDRNPHFDSSVFGEKFDFFLARAIWTHAAKPQIYYALEGAALPPVGSATCLRRGGLVVEGVVAWRDEAHCGLYFKNSIDVAAWVKRVGSEGQQKVDAAMADIRRGSAGRTTALFPNRNRQDVLSEAGAELLRISERIAALPGMTIELAEELMKLDALAHLLKTVR